MTNETLLLPVIAHSGVHFVIYLIVNKNTPVYSKEIGHRTIFIDVCVSFKFHRHFDSSKLRRSRN